MTTKEMFKITLNLVVIYVVGGLIMAFVYAKTSPIMFIKAKEEKEAALKAVGAHVAEDYEELATLVKPLS